MVQKYRFSGNSMLDTLLCLAVAGTATLYVHEIFIISSVTLNWTKPKIRHGSEIPIFG